MNRMAFVRRLMGLAASTAIALSSGSARAHGGDEVERSSSDPSVGPDPVAQPPPAAVGATAWPVTLSVDLVLGWGKAPFAVQNLPGMGSQPITYTYAAATQSDVQSFVFAGSVEVAKHLTLGARVPLSFATFTPPGASPDGAAARSTESFGNLELMAEYGTRTKLSRTSTLGLVTSLAVALPTALGDEIPANLAARDASLVDVNAYDRFSLARAASMSRGEEESALFEPKRLGLVPRLALLYQGPSLSLEPSVKVENLLSVSNSLEAPYIGEIVPGLRVGYRVRRNVELDVRGWANVRFASASGDRRTSAAVEPAVVLRFGPVLPYAGVVVPVGGLPYFDSFFGIRLGVRGSF